MRARESIADPGGFLCAGVDGVRDPERGRPAAHAISIFCTALIAKPDIGWHGHGVRRIDTRVALENYLAHFPESRTLMLQRYVPFAGEAAE